MKHTLLFMALLLSAVMHSQIINIPDANFKATLLAATTDNGIARDVNQNFIVVDTNGNNEIEVSEAAVVYHLMVGMYDIASLTGIESFTNLETLECSSNSLTVLDVTMLSNLRDLSCNNNQLTMVNVAGLSELEWLNCSNNNLTSINLAGCSMLHDLDFSYNMLTSINLSAQQLVLENLICNNNALTSLNLAGFTLLDYLLCEYNNMTSLDLTGCANLFYIATSNNQITSLDISDSPLVELFDADTNQLEVLIIKNGTDNSDSFIDFGENPLQYLCVDESEATAYVEILDFYGYDNVQMNSYCTFTPGGTYNTITGAVTFAGDDNLCNTGDFGQTFVKMNINDGINQGSTFTNSAGVYNFYTMEGDFTITPEFENDWFTASPISANVNFAAADNSVQTENFCITANGVHNDIEVVMVPIIPAQPGFEAVYKIVYRNKGNQVLSGTVDCFWDASYFSSLSLMPPPDVQATGYYMWNYNDLQPHETREVVMTLTVNTPTATPPVNNGDILTFTATATQTGVDEMPADNAFVLDQEVVGSFDPNNIICIEGETASPDMIGEYLHYVINFENTGTAPATFIAVLTEINPADFDINTLQILNSSHEMEVKIEGNTIQFFFDNINLAAAEHGNILFKLKSKPGLMAGDSVVNSANIYFDYNWPIETNEAATIFAALSTGDFAVDSSVKLYPNPSGGLVRITADTNINAYELYDIQGRLLQSGTVNDTTAQLNISQRAAGIYLLKVKTESGVRVEKIIKE